MEYTKPLPRGGFRRGIVVVDNLSAFGVPPSEFREYVPSVGEGKNDVDLQSLGVMNEGYN